MQAGDERSIGPEVDYMGHHQVEIIDGPDGMLGHDATGRFAAEAIEIHVVVTMQHQVDNYWAWNSSVINRNASTFYVVGPGGELVIIEQSVSLDPDAEEHTETSRMYGPGFWETVSGMRFDKT